MLVEIWMNPELRIAAVDLPANTGRWARSTYRISLDDFRYLRRFMLIDKVEELSTGQRRYMTRSDEFDAFFEFVRNLERYDAG